MPRRAALSRKTHPELPFRIAREKPARETHKVVIHNLLHKVENLWFSSGFPG
jgi:hypothetical protein